MVPGENSGGVPCSAWAAGHFLKHGPLRGKTLEVDSGVLLFQFPKAWCSVPMHIGSQLDVLPAWAPTVWNVLLVLASRVVRLTMQTTIIRAIITAYSTAVGPSSERRKWKRLLQR